MSRGSHLNFQLNLACVMSDTFGHLFSLVGVFIYSCYAIILAVCAVGILFWKHNFWLSSTAGHKNFKHCPIKGPVDSFWLTSFHFQEVVADKTFNHNNATKSADLFVGVPVYMKMCLITHYQVVQMIVFFNSG